jgi:hypothetical protein
MITIKDYEIILAQARELVEKKNLDYAGDDDFLANFKMSKMMGIKPSMGVLLRISDKFARLCQLVQGDPNVADEKIRDTLLDLLNYSALMMLCLDDEEEMERLTERREVLVDRSL